MVVVVVVVVFFVVVVVVIVAGVGVGVGVGVVVVVVLWLWLWLCFFFLLLLLLLLWLCFFNQQNSDPKVALRCVQISRARYLSVAGRTMISSMGVLFMMCTARPHRLWPWDPTGDGLPKHETVDD